MLKISVFIFAILLGALQVGFTQKLDTKYVKGIKYNVPPDNPLPTSYQKYNLKFNIDSLELFLMEGAYNKKLAQSIKDNFQDLRPMKSLEYVKEEENFYFEIWVGHPTIHSSENVVRPVKTNPAKNGYIKEIRYSFPFKLSLNTNDGQILYELISQSESRLSPYKYDPNFNTIKGGSYWIPEEVFTTIQDLETEFRHDLKDVYDDLIMDELRQLINHDAKQLIEALFIGYKDVSYTPRFYLAKAKKRQFDYSDLDSAYFYYEAAFIKLNTNPEDRLSYLPEFEKALQICFNAYNKKEPRMTFELKNGMLYNIASIYYHMGNSEEARKYASLYLVDSWDYISPENINYKPEYDKHDIHFVLFEKYWGNKKY